MAGHGAKACRADKGPSTIMHSAPVLFVFFLFFVFRSSKSKFPLANFGSIIEVIMEYVGNRRSDKPAGGCRTKGLDPCASGYAQFDAG